MNEQVRKAIQHWPKIAPLLAAPKRRSDFNRLQAALDEVLDAGGADEKSPLASLANHLGDLIEDYENRNVSRGVMSIPDFLRELFRQRGLTQAQIPEIGSQGVVSEVLSGKRELNVRQISALSARFKLPVGAFIDLEWRPAGDTARP